MQGQTGPSFNVCLGGRGEATQGYVSRCGGAGRVLEHNEIMDMEVTLGVVPFTHPYVLGVKLSTSVSRGCRLYPACTCALSSARILCSPGSLLRSFVSDPPEVSSPTADTAAQVTLGMTNLWLSSTLHGGVRA